MFFSFGESLRLTLPKALRILFKSLRIWMWPNHVPKRFFLSLLYSHHRNYSWHMDIFHKIKRPKWCWYVLLFGFYYNLWMANHYKVFRCYIISYLDIWALFHCFVFTSDVFVPGWICDGICFWSIVSNSNIKHNLERRMFFTQCFLL